MTRWVYPPCPWQSCGFWCGCFGCGSFLCCFAVFPAGETQIWPGDCVSSLFCLVFVWCSTRPSNLHLRPFQVTPATCKSPCLGSAQVGHAHLNSCLTAVTKRKAFAHMNPRQDERAPPSSRLCCLLPWLSAKAVCLLLTTPLPPDAKQQK